MRIVQLALVLSGSFALGIPATWPLLALLIGLGLGSNVYFARRISRNPATKSSSRWWSG